MARTLRSSAGASRGLIVVCVSLALPLLAAASSIAQQNSGYDSLVDAYAAGRAADAVLTLGGWTRSAVGDAVSNSARRMTPARQRAAVMLHTDTAYAFLVARDLAGATMHLGAARRILSEMHAAGRADERTQAFEPRWFAFAASLYSAQGRLQDADLIVRDGMALYPRDARLHVMRGAIREMDGTLAAAAPRASRQVRTGRWFESAAADFRRAISLDETLSPAYLHLGWVRMVAHDDRCGADFEAALAHAADDAERYLAHLFLGAFEEQRRRLDGARDQYEAALRAGPAYQTAYVALGRIEEALGHSARAQELARTFASLREKREDPWWDYHLGAFDQTTLEWLRREARTP